MLESIVPAISSLMTAVKAKASFEAFRKRKRGDTRSLIEELKENSRLCFRVIEDRIDHKIVIPKLSTVEYDRLNRSGFDYNLLKSGKVRAYARIEGTDLASWPGKSTAELVGNIYDKIKDLKSLNDFHQEKPSNRRRLINVHKRIILLLRHSED